MSKNIRVIFAVLLVAFAVFSFRVVKFWLDDSSALSKEKNEMRASGSSDGYYTFLQDGKYGIKNSKGKIIAEPVYQSVIPLAGNSFMVSKNTPGGLRYGITDSSGNTEVPFIYTEMRSLMGEVLFAVTADGSMVLFDFSGRLVSGTEWDSIEKNYTGKRLSESGNYIQLEKNGDIYRMVLNEDCSWTVRELLFRREIMGVNQTVKAKNTADFASPDEIISLYNEVYDRADAYINAVFSGDSAAVKNLAWNDEYRDLLLEGLSLRGGSVISMNIPEPVIEAGENSTVSYTCNVSLVYESPDDPRWDDTFTYSEHTLRLEICMKKKTDGRLAVTKVYASRDN